MERRTFLKTMSSVGLFSLFSPSFAMDICKPQGKAAASSFEAGFLHPPFSSGVYTWWHWMNGNITKDGITRDLEAMKANGVAGYQLFEAGSGIPVGPVESLSDEWVELILHAIRESERLGLEFCMHNCPGWSSSGGPWITPDKAMQLVTWSETSVKGGGKVQVQLPMPPHKFDYYADTYCLAIPANVDVVPRKSVMDISASLQADGTLLWDAPEGDWTVLRFGQTAKDQMNHSAPTKSTGLDCDKFSTEALDYHLDCMFRKLMPAMEKMARHAKVGLLIDSYEMGDQDWTLDMPAYFEQKAGYPLWPFLPVWTGKTVDDEDATQRFRFDFKRTQADMFADRYYSHFQKRCKEKGIITYTEPYGGGMMEELQVAQRLDINMGEFWCGQTMLWPNFLLNRTVKQVASVAHTLGGNIVGAEAFTSEPDSDKWLLYPYALKSLGDYMFTRGLTRIYFHRYVHQPHPTAMPGMTMGPWGLHFDRTNTWWKPGKAWITYLNRCQYVFQHSAFYADMLYHSGDNTFGTTIEPEQTPLAPPEGYDYDIVNTEILEKAVIKDGKIVLPATKFGGYKLLVFPVSDAITMPTLRVLARLVRAGMVLVARKPKYALGMEGKRQEGEFRMLIDEIWSSPHVYEEGLPAVLEQLEPSPDFSFHSVGGENSIHAIHYQQDGKHLYFVANRKRCHEQGVAFFRVKGCVPELWNPYTGEIVACPVFRETGHGIELPLELSPAGSMFVVFKPCAQAGSHWTDLKIGGTSLFELPSMKVQHSLHTNFSIACWIKPELDIALTDEQEFGALRTRCFALYPADGEALYGRGHSVIGLSVGRNGVAVYERSHQTQVAFRKVMPVSGWNHLVLVCQNNVPSVWLNGMCIGTGNASQMVVHAQGKSDCFSKADAFDGEIQYLHIYDHVLGEHDIKQLAREDISRLPLYRFPPVTWLSARQLVVWSDGSYELSNDDTGLRRKVDRHAADLVLDGKWELHFPPKSGAPEAFSLSKLHSLHLEKDFGVRHFSGTVKYVYYLQLDERYIKKDLRLRLDLGRVAVIAEVFVDNKPAGVCWAPPYGVDVTGLLHKGTNKLEIRVTNLWVNRLIGDEYLPEENSYNYQDIDNKFAALNNGGIKELPDWYKQGRDKPSGGRIAFATWRHYDKESPLTESGLIGPVTLQVGKIETL